MKSAKEWNIGQWWREGFLLISVLVCGLMPIYGQEFENRNGNGGQEESTYLLKMEIEYQENDRNTEETNYYDVHQKRSRKEAKGRLDLNFFHLDGLYKETESIVEIGADESRLTSTRDSVGAWIEFLRYFYVFGNKRGYDSYYHFIDNAAESFSESETAGSITSGIGVQFGDWRAGISPGSDFTWSYRVDALGQRIIRESIAFEVGVLEIVKQATDRQGPYYELGAKWWQSRSVADDRDGSLERFEGYLILGMGFSENSLVYLGQNVSLGTIESVLTADDSDMSRRSTYSNSVIGLQLGLGEKSAVYVERDFAERRIDLENVSFESENKNQEEEYTIGVLLNEQISLELNLGKVLTRKAYSEKVVTAQSYRYQQSDQIVGVSLNILFSN